MNRAPESVVRSVMDALDCEPDANRQFCVTCSNPTGDWDEDAGCATARKVADAAWAASLRAAAERLDEGGSLTERWGAKRLRRWADESGA